MDVFYNERVSQYKNLLGKLASANFENTLSMEIQSASFFVLIKDFELGSRLLSEVLSKEYLGVSTLDPSVYEIFKMEFVNKLNYCNGIIRANIYLD